MFWKKWYALTIRGPKWYEIVKRLGNHDLTDCNKSEFYDKKLCIFTIAMSHAANTKQAT